MGIVLHVLEYAVCAGMVAIGFGSISNVPLKAFKGCAMLGALGYIARYLLMTLFDVHVIPASFIGAIAIGIFASMAGRHWNTPAESIAYPALLPMNLGMYAYRTVEGILMCLKADDEVAFLHASYFLQYNGMVYVMVVLAMVLGVTIPVHMDYRRKGVKKFSVRIKR